MPDRDEIERNARELFNIFEHRRVPMECMTGAPSYPLIDAIREAVAAGCFSIATMQRLPSKWAHGCREYLCSLAASGYNDSSIDPRAEVTIRVGAEAVAIKAAKVRIVKRHGDHATSSGLHRYTRTRTKLSAGEVATLPAARAIGLLLNYSSGPYDDEWLETHSYTPQRRDMVEVGGALTVYRDDGTTERLTWGEQAKAPRRPRSEAA